MNAFFQLWDTTSGNLVTEFESEQEATEALYQVLSEDGANPLLEWALLKFQEGHPSLVAKGSDLVVYVARAGRHREKQRPLEGARSSD